MMLLNKSLALTACCACLAAGATVDYDVIVYGATPGGIMSAIAAANESSTISVLLVHPLGHIGGMSASGLGQTDVGNAAVIGGASAQYFNTYCECSKGKCAPGNVSGSLCTELTPHMAEQTFQYMIDQVGSRLTVVVNMTLQSVGMSGNVLQSLNFVPTEFAESHPQLRVGLGAPAARAEDVPGAQSYSATVFMDGSYEGDLFAYAGVSYAVGRESRAQYNESYAGRLAAPNSVGGHQFAVPVSPYDSPGVLSPLISQGPFGVPGEADGRVQAFNFRLCLTENTSNLLPIGAPQGYDASYWDLAARYINAINATNFAQFFNIGKVSKDKTDINNNGPISTDIIGKSWGWPEGTPAQRAELWTLHKNITQGFIYFLATDPRIPVSVRTGMSAWGLCADEFTDNGGWPWQLYVREGRRMVSDFVFTQHDREEAKVKPDCVGAYSYNIDAHNAQRFFQSEGSKDTVWTRNEGDVEKDGNLGAGSMPYRMLVPKRSEATNLLVPISCSASHIGFGTIRLEPQWMMLGQAAGIAAAQAVEKGSAVQDVDVTDVQARLTARGAKLQYCQG